MALSFGVLVAAMLVLVVLGATFGIPFTADSGLYGNERSDVLKDLSLVADLKKDRFLLWLQERKNDTRALSRSENVLEQVERLRKIVGDKMRSASAGDALWIDIRRQASYQRLNRLFRMVRRSYRVYDKIQVGDAATGRVFFSTDEKDLGSRVSKRRDFAEVLDSVRGVSIGVEKDPSSDKPFLTIARVIEDQALSNGSDRPVPAVLIMYIDTDYLIKPMLHTGEGLGRTGEVVLVNQDGRILMDLKYPLADGTRAKALEHKIEAKAATLAAGGKEGIVISEDYRGVPVLAAYRHIRVTPDQGWGMVVKRDRAEVFAPMRHRILISLWIGAIGILGTIALAVLISARISGPIRGLSRTAEEVEAGNLSVRSPVSGSDEVGTLASTFNSMIERIQNWHIDLEEQVKARTSALTAEIEERTRAERAVREGEARYRSLVENMGNAVAIYTAVDEGEDFVFVDFNSAGEKIEQISRDQLIGKSILEAFPGLKDFGLFDVLQRVWRTGDPEHHPVKLYKDERIEGWRDNFVYRLPSGEIVAVYSDETQRRQAEEALGQSADRYRLLVQNAPIGIISVDTEGRITEVNQRLLEILGSPSAEATKSINLLTFPPLVEAGISEKTKICMEENRPIETETPYTSKWSKSAHLRVLLRPMHDSRGIVQGCQAMVEDVTERRDMQRQLRQAQKMEAIGTLAGGIAHDFNNLLTIILGYAELGLLEKSEGEPGYEELRTILKTTNRGADLVRQILTFSREVETKPRPVSLNHEVEHVQKLLYKTIPKMIKIDLFLDEDLKTINADPVQVEQVLMNLAVNAKDAMPEGGKLVFETKNATLDEEYCKTHLEAEPGEYVLLMVSDTGHGIEKEALGRIFEPFYTTKKPGEGTGLGLSVVHGIVKQNHGFIMYYSEPSAGTTFRIYLPIIDLEVEPDTASTGEMPAFGTETILVVDDEELIRGLGKRILTEAGYTVLTAGNGQEALEVYQKQQADISLVILDLIMPEMGGRECLEELLKIDPKVKVVISSGLSVNGSTREAIKGQTRGFVGKPFDMKQLLQAVRKVLDES